MVSAGNSTTCLPSTESIQVQLMACKIGVLKGIATPDRLNSFPWMVPDYSVYKEPTLWPDDDVVWRKWTTYEYQDPMISYVWVICIYTKFLPSNHKPLIIYTKIRKLIFHSPPSQSHATTTLSSQVNNIELGNSSVIASPYMPSILER